MDETGGGDVAVNAAPKQPTSSILTEDMIDAAMIKRLNIERILEDGDSEIVDGDHNYCGGDDNYNENDESDDDYNEVTVFCGDSGEDEAIVTNQKNNCNKKNDTNDRIVNDIVKKHEDRLIVKTPDNINNIVSSSTVITVNKIDESDTRNNFKQTSLTIKPISNLMKQDNFKSPDNNVRVFKCIQGRIELQSDTVTSGNKTIISKKNLLSTSCDSDSSSVIELSQSSDENDSVKNNSRNKDSSAICANDSIDQANEISNVEVTESSKVVTVETSENKRLVDILESPLLSNKIGHDSTLNIVHNTSTTDNVELPTMTSTFANKFGNKTNIIGKNVSNFTTNRKLVNVSPKQLTGNRRQILPKINFRYHTKDSVLVTSTKLNSNTITLNKKPNNMNSTNITTTISTTNNNNNTITTSSTISSTSTTTNSNNNNNNNVGFIVPNKTNVQPVLIMTPDLVSQPSSAFIQLKSPPLSSSSQPQTPPNNNQIKYVINRIEPNSQNKSVRPVSTTVTKEQISILKDASGKIWEKVDPLRSLNKEKNDKAKHLEMDSASIKIQILERDVPVYKPVDSNQFYSCLDCNDRFVLESSLRFHRFRKSVLIRYWCRVCSCSIVMYNRCMFLSHLRSHNQSVKTLDMSSLVIEALPKELFKFGLDDAESNTTPSTSNQTTSPPLSPHSVFISVPPNSNASSVPGLNIRSSVATTVSKMVGVNTVVRNDQQEKPRFNSNKKVIQTTKKFVRSDLGQVTVGNSDKESSASVNNDETDTELIAIDPKEPNRVHNQHRNLTASPDNIEITICNSQENSEANNTTIPTSNEVNKEPLKNQPPKLKDKQIKGRRSCPECDAVILAKHSLRKHLQNFNRPGDESLKCNVCRLILPTNCALKMHLRIHMKLKPFRCPECAIEFHVYDRFLMHLKYTCCHLNKCVRFVCTLCGNMQVTLANLEQHLLTRHVRSIYKCGGCPIAFINLKSVEKHKDKVHPGVIVQTNAYRQCRLCPEKLIPKKRFLEHMKTHVNDDKLCIYAYQCVTCKFTFFQRTELIYHRMKCEPKNEGIKSYLNSSPKSPTNEIAGESILVNANNDEEEQEIDLPSKKRKFGTVDDNNDDNMEESDCIFQGEEQEQDPLNLDGFQADEELLREPRIESCVVCKKEKVIILPGKKQSSQSLCCKKCVSPCGIMPQNNLLKTKLQAAKLKGYKCKICNSSEYMDLKLIYEHFKANHKNLEGQSINEWLTIDNRVHAVKRSNTFTTAETIKEKYKKKKLSSQPVQQVKKDNIIESCEQKGNNVIEKRKGKRFVKVKQKPVVEGNCFESGQLIKSEEEAGGETDFKCCKCSFITNNKDELHDHVICHRTDPNALQCLECGDCFVVLPSLEKHLIINHRIANVDEYIANNKRCVENVGQDNSVADETVKDQPEDDVDNNTTCRVCHEVFDSKTSLDKHFRSHGMAFLFKNVSK